MSERDDELRGVDEALRAWRQGDCVVGEEWFSFRFRSSLPLTDEAEEVSAEDNEADIAEAAVRGLMVATQTCDVVRSCFKRPFVEVCPLAEVDNDVLRAVERGQRPRYAYVPGVANQRLVADLDRVMTVEKAVIAAWNRTPGCTDDAQRRRLALALARKRARFAFPDDFTELAGKFQERLQKKHDKHSAEGRALRALREIRVRAAPSWGAETVEIFFWFIRDDDDEDFEEKSWDEYVTKWLKLVPETERFHAVHGQVSTLDDLKASDYVESDPLDFDHLSSRQS